jgi:hypothetical protein
LYFAKNNRRETKKKQKKKRKKAPVLLRCERNHAVSKIFGDLTERKHRERKRHHHSLGTQIPTKVLVQQAQVLRVKKG